MVVVIARIFSYSYLQRQTGSVVRLIGQNLQNGENSCYKVCQLLQENATVGISQSEHSGLIDKRVKGGGGIKETAAQQVNTVCSQVSGQVWKNHVL